MLLEKKTKIEGHQLQLVTYIYFYRVAINFLYCLLLHYSAVYHLLAAFVQPVAVYCVLPVWQINFIIVLIHSIEAIE